MSTENTRNRRTLSLSRRTLGGVALALGESFFAQCKAAVAQTAASPLNVKVDVGLGNMSPAIEARLRDRITKMLVDERYVTNATALSMSSGPAQQSGPSDDPDYSEFWVQMVPKGTSSQVQNTDWSEEQWNEIMPSWDEMIPSSDHPSPNQINSILTMNFKQGSTEGNSAFYKGLLETLHKNQPK